MQISANSGVEKYLRTLAEKLVLVILVLLMVILIPSGISAQETDTPEVQMKEAETSSFIPSQSIEPITKVLSQQVQSDIINEKHATKIKETVLVATLCVLAGSTGIGHYFRT